MTFRFKKLYKEIRLPYTSFIRSEGTSDSCRLDGRRFFYNSHGRNFSMKRIMTLALAAAMVFGAATGASAIDFKASGQWLFGVSAGEGNLVNKHNGRHADTNDTFFAGQRLRTQIDAVASEALSGTVYFEIGDQTWGNGESGAAMGADGTVVEVKRAYLDWVVPNTDLKVRMGIQGLTLPNVAGGSAIADTDAAGITVNYQINENVGLTALWTRPVNDNFSGNEYGRNSNYLDNIDLFAVTLPLNFDGVSVTPWVMYGMMGKNALTTGWDPSTNAWEALQTKDGSVVDTLTSRFMGMNTIDGLAPSTSKAYGSLFWAGLPIKVTTFDPLNIEVDINYGYAEKMGRYSVLKRGVEVVRASTKREGWLAKALVEYKMDWGTPGIFGWYASGDDGNVKNGSERMPSLSPCPTFTSMMGAAGIDWNPTWTLYERSNSYDGSWGIGLRIADMSFVDDLKHTFIAAYRGGTNSPAMVKYMNSAVAWNQSTLTGNSVEGPYLTTNDGLLEFNLLNSWQIYENLQMHLDLAYVVNMIDKDTWERSFMSDNFSKQDAWKAQLVFAYSF